MLNLDFCTLSSLPPVLGQLTSLTTLDVEGNLYLGDSFRGVTTPAAAPMLPGPHPFPMDLAGLQELRFLNLNSCGLTSIPSVSALQIATVDFYRELNYRAHYVCRVSVCENISILEWPLTSHATKLVLLGSI